MKEAYAQCVLTLTAAKIRKKTQAMLLRELKLKGFSDRAMQRILDDITTGRNDSIGSDGDRKIAEHADRVIR
jgi:hypothetical protein